ncbi:DUF2951 family protein [Staphylococcus xylosus]
MFFKRSDHEWRIRRLEDNDKKIFDSLEQIKDGQRIQEKISEKLDRTLEVINIERSNEKKMREENEKFFKEIKMKIFGILCAVIASIIISLSKVLFGL